MSLWTQQFAQALRREQLKRLPPAHLDAILLWLSHPENPQSADLTEAFSRVDLSCDTASRRIYSLLDQQLFSGSPPAPTTLGLAPNTAPEIVKQRYRRLMQVYHPDRHATKPLWATQRTERINLAFGAHRRGTHGWARSTALSKTIALRQAQLQQFWQQIRPYWRHLALGLALISVGIGSIALLLNTSPKLIAPPPMITAAPAPLDCNSVLLPLINFQRAYRTGELNALMALYSSAAQENELTDWWRIRQAYAEWFHNTSARSIHFTQVRIKTIADNLHCVALANYEVNYQNAQSQQITRVGLIVFLFEQQAATFHIVRMRY